MGVMGGRYSILDGNLQENLSLEVAGLGGQIQQLGGADLGTQGIAAGNIPQDRSAIGKLKVELSALQNGEEAGKKISSTAAAPPTVQVAAVQSPVKSFSPGSGMS